MAKRQIEWINMQDVKEADHQIPHTIELIDKTLICSI